MQSKHLSTEQIYPVSPVCLGLPLAFQDPLGFRHHSSHLRQGPQQMRTVVLCQPVPALLWVFWSLSHTGFAQCMLHTHWDSKKKGLIISW